MSRIALGVTLLAFALFLDSSAIAAQGSSQEFSWTGVYIGPQVGGGWGKSDWNFNDASGPVNDRSPGDDTDHDISGWMAGAQIGLNYQLGQVVLGLEPSFSGGNIDGSSRSTFGAADDKYTTKLGQLFLVTGRGGWALGRWLPYFKAGYAGGRVTTRVIDDVGPNAGSGGKRVYQNGYTVGGGLEYMLTWNITAGAEYNYVNLGRDTHRRLISDGGFISDDVKVHVHRMMFRVNFLFNWN
ncbi:MAG TPA: outer membrane beta-barrel protein [Candidatus Binatia bacterium]